MKISREFSKYAREYPKFNQIQEKVAKKLITSLRGKPKKILDLGCGSGAIYNLLDWKPEKFVGVDFSHKMLELHPKASNVRCILGDFNDAALFEDLLKEDFDYVVSASALQWAEDLKSVFEHIARFDVPFSLVLFTSGTFAAVNKTAKIDPITPSKEQVIELAAKCLKADIEIVNYSLEFESVRDMFKYIKKSGVSAGRNVLDYKQTKRLMDEYPLNYLEFEVVYINSFSKA
ncbi:methyltransferase domain-containing protein [Sulfurimonas sp. HSL-1716]|uniref:methyltransferase domain-containing protein n=1 Tax=Hydrocurvibacter sulfurireducens TaxID=3131937 RepID=UPI0031FA23C8